MTSQEFTQSFIDLENASDNCLAEIRLVDTLDQYLQKLEAGELMIQVLSRIAASESPVHAFGHDFSGDAAHAESSGAELILKLLRNVWAHEKKNGDSDEPSFTKRWETMEATLHDSEQQLRKSGSDIEECRPLIEQLQIFALAEYCLRYGNIALLERVKILSSPDRFPPYRNLEISNLIRPSRMRRSLKQQFSFILE